MRLEQLCSDKTTFLTLTYDNESVPNRLEKYHVQNFLKRLRNASRDYGVEPFSLRYFFCGEYGKKTHRPHYHAILFGVDMLSPSWSPYLTGFNQGKPRYASHVVESIWPYGFNVVGDVTKDSIRYVSKYATKYYSSDNPDREFSLKSIGLGRGLFVDVRRIGNQYTYKLKKPFYDRYADGVLVLPDSHGFSCSRLPRVLDRYAERFEPEMYEGVVSSRRDYAIRHLPDMRLPSVRERDIKFNLDGELNKGELDNA